MTSLRRAIATLGAIGAGCVAYGTFIEREWYRLSRETVPGVLRGPAGTTLRILHVSDVHLDPPTPRLNAFLESVAQERYDLVVLTGDLLGAQDAEDACVAALAPLVADGTPALVVLGSNDYYAPSFKQPFIYFTDPEARVYGDELDTPRLLDGLGSIGVQHVNNEQVRVTTPAGEVVVTGIADPHFTEGRLPSPDIVRVDGDDPAALRLGLVHAPYTRGLDLLVDGGSELILSGHTHGGQVRFPPIGALTSNCDLPLNQARGVSRWGDAWLHVSVGLGTSRFAPFRFACRPEVCLLTLTA